MGIGAALGPACDTGQEKGCGSGNEDLASNPCAHRRYCFCPQLSCWMEGFA